MQRAVPILILLLAACSSPESHPMCASDDACPGGQLCVRSGGDGVCVAPYRLTLTSPAEGAWAGAQVSVAATADVLASGPEAPPALDLIAGGQPVATLARVGSTSTYQGTWSPAAGTSGDVVLQVAALRGSRAEQRSPPRTVQVDLEAPALSAVGASCAGGCRRDGRLRVEATVRDASVASVSAALDLDPSRTVPLLRQGQTDTWAADLELRTYPFPHFERAVQATVRAADRAGNQGTASAGAAVTRLRWAYASGTTGVTSPAVTSDGLLVIGAKGSSEQLRAVNPDGTEAWRTTVGAADVLAAPSVGTAAIWVGSEDGRMYGRLGDGSTVRYPTVEPLPAAALFTPAVGSGDTAYSAGGARRLYAAKADGSVGAATNTTDGVTSAAAAGSGGALFAATATATASATASIRRFTDPGDGVLTPDWATTPANASVDCTRIDAPPAVDASGNLLVACGNGQLYRLSAAGAATFLLQLAGKADASIVVRSDGDLVVGTNDSLLHRLTAASGGGLEERWASPPDLGAAVTGVVLAVRDGSGVDAVAVTASGGLYAVDASAGAVVWSTDGLAAPPLGVAALRFPAIAPAAPGSLPTLYAGSADGSLYAVVMDGALDAAAPWPKAHHDLRNSGNAGSPLP